MLNIIETVLFFGCVEIGHYIYFIEYKNDWEIKYKCL